MDALKFGAIQHGYWWVHLYTKIKVKLNNQLILWLIPQLESKKKQ